MFCRRRRLVKRLEAVETAVESVQTDLRQLTDERDNIRSTFNDLTLKLIHSQVGKLTSSVCTVTVSAHSHCTDPIRR